ncbi:hypothetical protein [Reinekea marina]|uniref:hypothetical protein n=1 Tax=Reinekea marina TaxID=1310421 RepID=UPI003F496631
MTTLTELKAIAAPATQGASRPIAAIGYLQHCNQTPKIDLANITNCRFTCFYCF